MNISYFSYTTEKVKMKKILEISVCLGFLVLSNIAFAGTATFYLLNSGDSVKHPITITKSSLIYYSSKECSGQIDGIADGIQVQTGRETTITAKLPNLPSTCVNINVTLNIYTVDGKGIETSCVQGYYFNNPSDNFSGETIKITETTDHFFCEYLSGSSK
jgi:hypothetical protein